jgi:hypothetical protein
MFNTDAGLMTLAGMDVEYDDYIDENLNRPHAWRDLEKKVTEFKTSCPYATVAFDSFSALGDILMYQIQAGHADQQPQLQEYNMHKGKAEDFLIGLATLTRRCNIVITCHEELIKDELIGSISYHPLFVGKKLIPRIPGYFDEVYRMFAEESRKDGVTSTRYGFHTKPGRQFTARTRLPGLDSVEYWTLEEGLYPHVMAKVQKVLAKEAKK